uniref:Hes-related family bHLH transcription factor with YRPW motif 2 n=1 Tax=Kryptolebias marmoratus TaxID=37003 RepID=A0A3Q3BE96_KRYMA
QSVPCEQLSSQSTQDEELNTGKLENMKASFIRCGSPTTTTQVMARKKRRGIIEKRRRDRINSSLSELRRLVPTAFEKQGSAKLEKAEILQLTVDHLKMLQATGGRGLLDAQVLALDFLSLGFRECVTEVSCYLDSGDPLRSRLLSHLASCASQRDAAALTAASHQQPHPFPHPLHPWAAVLRPLPYGPSGLLVLPDVGGGGGAPQRLGEVLQHSVASSTSSSSSFLLPCPPLSSPFLSLSAVSVHRGLPVLPPSFSPPSSSQPPPSSSKPYRPWGAEVGAF